MTTRSRRILAAGWLAMTVLWSVVAIQRHWAFGSSSFDLGIFTNGLWNWVNGNGYISSLKGDVSLLADHQMYVFVLFAPFFRLISTPETLLVLQAAVLASGGLAAYGLAKRYLPASSRWLAAVPWIYWAYLPVRAANSFDFHPEVVMLPAFLWGLRCLLGESRREQFQAWFFLVVALASKESAGPVAVGLGFSLAWIGRGRDGVILALLGALSFYVNLHWIPRWMAGAEYAYFSAFAHLGDGVSEVLLSPILRPSEFWGGLMNGPRLKFLALTLGALAFVPLWAPRYAVAALPAYLMLFMSQGDLRVNPHFHYGIEPAIGLFWAFGPGLHCLLAGRWKKWAVAWVVVWCVLGHQRNEVGRLIHHASVPQHLQWVRKEFLPSVAPDAWVTVSSALVPHLAARRWVRHLPDFEGADCVILENEVNQWPMDQETWGRMDATLRGAGYSELYACQSLRVYSRDGESCLSRRPECGSTQP